MTRSNWDRIDSLVEHQRTLDEEDYMADVMDEGEEENTEEREKEEHEDA